jgi:hypothetical protein
MGQMMAADFVVVPTTIGRLLFVLIMLAHDRRRIVHVAVTAHPTATWTAQQLAMTTVEPQRGQPGRIARPQVIETTDEIG